MIVLILFSLFIHGASKENIKDIKPITSELIKNSKTSDWRPLDTQNTVYMELAKGVVIIELNPLLAPKSVSNIKLLASLHYWENSYILRSQDNYVVQWGHSTNKKFKALMKKNKKILNTIPAEYESSHKILPHFTALPDKDVYADEVGFSGGFPVGREGDKVWPLHCYGAIGVGRDTNINSGNGSELYAVIGHSPRHLDRNITLVGRVVHGMEFLSTHPRGPGAMGFYKNKTSYVKIKSIKRASDVPIKKRLSLEILRTNTKLFQSLIEARRNRHEGWFHYKANRVEVCNITIPTRVL